MRTGVTPRRRTAPSITVGAGIAAAMALLATLLPPSAARAAEEPISETVTVSGHGWGHGRGLGQWGAFGYATGRSGGPWGYRTILGHFFGDTQVGGIGNPLAAVTLLEQRERPLTVERAAGVAVDGIDGTSGAVRVTRRDDGRFDVTRAGGCLDDTWSAPVVLDGPVRLRAPATTGEAADTLRLCHDDGTSTGYRGELVAMERTFDGHDAGLAQTVNLVRLDDLLRGVLPAQLPPAWADVDGGLGRQALLAQAVASRGFAAAGDGRWHDLHSGLGAGFTTCDAPSCQPYQGVTLEDARTSEVVRDTSGEVRVRGSSVVRSEYTASSGGWTAGISFPPVEDVGDAVGDNPHHDWTTFLDRGQIEARYGLGRLQAIHVLERNGLGADGGRVLRIRLVGTATAVEVTGAELRAHFGLRSDWFTVSGAPPRPPVEPRPIDDACPEAAVTDPGYTDVTDDNVHRRAIACATWWGVAEGTGGGRYRPAGFVTRGQMASFVARFVEASGTDLPDQAADVFEDDDGTEHEDAINALAAVDIARGKAPGIYAPNGLIDRAQTASLVARALTHLGLTLASTPDAFADDTDLVHEAAINGLAAEGVVTGVAAGRLEPLEPTRRDQTASLLARALDLVVDELGAPLPDAASPMASDEPDGATHVEPAGRAPADGAPDAPARVESADSAPDAGARVEPAGDAPDGATHVEPAGRAPDAAAHIEPAGGAPDGAARDHPAQ